MALGPLVEPTHREGSRWAGGSGLEAIVFHNLAGFPHDVGHEMGVLQLLVLCPLNQLGWGPLGSLSIAIQELQPKVPKASVAGSYRIE